MVRWLERVRPLLCVALIAVVPGCTDSPFGSGERRALAQARARWLSNRPDNYAIEIRLSCFCGNVYAEFTRLEVHGDSIVAAAFVTPQPGQPDPPLTNWPTVDGLFSMLSSLTSQDYDYISDISARYDATYGFPTEIHVSCMSNVTDCGSTTYARNLQPLP